MDKNVLKRFAIESRKHLHEKVADRYALYYLDEEFDEVEKDELYSLTNEKHNLVLTKEQYEHRQKLLKKKDRYGKDHVIEEAAFTWFNRFICLRYMEIHNFLPLGKNNESLDIRVLSSRDGNKEPEILKRNNLTNNSLDINVDIDIDKLEKITDINEKYEKVLLKLCEKMGKVLPQIFDGETDYIELLMPKNQLNVDSFLDKLLKEVPEDNFNDIEVIGWLYQYYITEEHEKTINSTDKKKLNDKEICYASQIFTPDWIVKYMVENSLGRLWIENTGDESLESEFKYFIKDNIEINVGGKDNRRGEACEPESVGASYASPMLPENITFVDPCMGSGHILVYAFEIFMKLYISAGYNKRDIPELILKNNLYGLDIDDRAGQFAIISVMLKAREYDSEIFNKIDFSSLNILSIPESNPELRQYANDIKDKEVHEIVDYRIDTFENGKEIGSLLKVEEKDYDKVTKYFEQATPNLFNRILQEELRNIIRVAKILSKKYDVVVTNPPYLNNYVMPNDLKQYLNENFSAGSKDLFSAFMCRNIMLTKVNKYCAYMTPNVWMFIVSYLDMRLKLIKDIHIESLVLMAKGSFFKEATVDITAFVIKNEINNEKGVYINLEPYKGDMTIQENALLNELKSEIPNNKYIINQQEFTNIPNSVFGFWLSENIINDFKISKQLKEIAEPKEGLSTSDNKKFLRIWWEVSIFDEQLNSNDFDSAKVSKAKFFPFNKGGDYRKWYGNNDYVIN